MTNERTLLSVYLFLDNARRYVDSGDLEHAADTIGDTLDQLWRLLSDDEHRMLNERPDEEAVMKARRVIEELEYRVRHALRVKHAFEFTTSGRLDIAADYDEEVRRDHVAATRRCDALERMLQDARARLANLKIRPKGSE